MRDQVGDLATFLPINTGPLNTLKRGAILHIERKKTQKTLTLKTLFLSPGAAVLPFKLKERSRPLLRSFETQAAVPRGPWLCLSHDQRAKDPPRHFKSPHSPGASHRLSPSSSWFPSTRPTQQPIRLNQPPLTTSFSHRLQQPHTLSHLPLINTKPAPLSLLSRPAAAHPLLADPASP